ncbi:Transposase [Methanosarcina barkeri str. Wiesmoor]|uniref:Transposase n=1 Tax=Methanosarcina barkeri str. Wiesmoor TaxID=1434109 RepID=A0A0E3QNH0_METBA|nr:Transposase [Methanosarcina barkeri str. Wiesmoor]
MYVNKTTSDGRPEADVIIMFKMLFLQQWHGLSDPELEKQCIDHLSFRNFLGFPDNIPDSTTVWSFRKRIIDNSKEEEIWGELRSQLDFWFKNQKRNDSGLYFYSFRSRTC